ncbi:unnamed protein product [Orchesella dallaii]|uniref:Uncharacterized protein n=1 Tax=Orchesella dallaii TaxID=48710 RepID=A0ABP1R8E6_9HEXA
MRAITVSIVVACVLAVQAMPFPQNFDDAVKQAQQMSLIPVGAVVDRTSSGIQVAYFKLGENDKVNTDDLRAALEGIPPEVVASLESQVANVGRP